MKYLLPWLCLLLLPLTASDSWIESANDLKADFPIENLPYGVFQRKESQQRPRIGIAIGDQVFDVKGALHAGLLGQLPSQTTRALEKTNLNAFMDLGKEQWSLVRTRVQELLAADNPKLRDNKRLRSQLILSMDQVQLQLPAQVGDFTDFYASLHHATNVGRLFRPNNPLMPNYKHLPVGYHGRASSVVLSGTEFPRPQGQVKCQGSDCPEFQPCQNLDYEMELGILVGPGNELGSRIEMREAPDHIFGMVIVNDWSARDIQKWEYQPLGPFNAKNFVTTISPWVVTLDALEPYRLAGPPRAESDPKILNYLQPVDDLALDITVEVYIQSEAMRQRGIPPQMLSQGSFSDMYWTIAQMLVHHTSTGCNMRPGDLLGTGTISGPESGQEGSLLEITLGGAKPLRLNDGTSRRFLADGDEVILKAYAEKEGLPRIGFGDCRGRVKSAS